MIDRDTANGYWDKAASTAREFRETNDCTVKALSIAGDISYSEAHAYLRAAGRKSRKGCNWAIQWEAADAAGFVVYDLTNHCDGRTVITIERELRRRFPNGRFLIGTRRHRLAFRDGHVIDHSRGSRRRIVSVYMLVRKDAEQPRGYEFERTRLVKAFTTTDEPYVVEQPEPEVVETPAEPLTQKPRSRKVRRMTTKIRATGAEHPITTARVAMGLSTNEVGKRIGFPGASLWRIERGLNIPRREVARELHEFFGGALPIGAIYDGPYWLESTPQTEVDRVIDEVKAFGAESRNAA